MTALKTPHLLLLPGLLNDARLWQHQIDGLADVAHATVADLTSADSIAALASAAAVESFASAAPSLLASASLAYDNW